MVRPSEPTRVQPHQTPDAHRSELHPLWSAYSALILLAARIYQLEPVGKSPDELRRTLQNALQEARRRALSAFNMRPADVDEAEFAVVVTLNEAIRMSGGELRSAWASSPLEIEAGKTALAGHQFYTVLDRLEREGRVEVLWIFYFCLKAGFQGELTTGDRQHGARLARLTQRLSGAASPDILFPPLLVAPPRPAPPPASDTLRTQIIAAVGGALLLGLVVIAWVAWSAGVLASDLQAASPSSTEQVEQRGASRD